MGQQIGIAGAGLLGRLLAWLLVQRGHEVQVFDPAADPLARGAAGWTAAGMLSPVAELDHADTRIFQLGQRSVALWPAIVQSLQEAGQTVDLHQNGSLLLAHRSDQGSAQRCLDQIRRKAPPASTPLPLTAAQLLDLEPAFAGAQAQALQAWHLPQEAHIHTVQAMQALQQAAQSRGVRWHWGCPVQVQPGRIKAGDVEHEFDLVFDVRGLGARGDAPIDSAQRSLRGVRGEIFWLQAPEVPLRRPLRLLHPRHRVYLVPRRDNIIVVGASEIESEDRSPVSVRSTVELLAAAHSLLPGLAEARIVHSETNLRPALPDNLPCVIEQDQLIRINGLFRHGWLLAPALAQQALDSQRWAGSASAAPAPSHFPLACPV